MMVFVFLFFFFSFEPSRLQDSKMVMRCTRVIAVMTCAMLVMNCVSAALPPGYEDELYCPPGSCLQKKEVRQS
jgi:hypothetical protein